MYQVVFLGTSIFAVPALKKLAASQNFNVLLIVTQPDAPQGRKKVLTPTPVKDVAKKLSLNLFTPEKIKDLAAIKKITDLKPDFLVLAAYGQILPKELLVCAKYGAVNIHPSLLPKYRGPAPVQFAILNGEEETGVSIILMDEKIDHGPILTQKSVKIDKDETAPELKARLAQIAASILPSTLADFACGKIKPKEQDHFKATVTTILKREAGQVDWKKSARKIYNMWRAYEPWPGVFTEIGIKKSRQSRGFRAKPEQELRTLKLNKIKMADLRRETVEQYKIGEVFVHDKKLLVRCGQGAVELEKIQLEGKKEADVYAFSRGHHEFIGSILV